MLMSHASTGFISSHHISRRLSRLLRFLLEFRLDRSKAYYMMCSMKCMVCKLRVPVLTTHPRTLYWDSCVKHPSGRNQKTFLRRVFTMCEKRFLNGHLYTLMHIEREKFLKWDRAHIAQMSLAILWCPPRTPHVSSQLVNSSLLWLSLVLDGLTWIQIELTVGYNII